MKYKNISRIVVIAAIALAVALSAAFALNRIGAARPVTAKEAMAQLVSSVSYRDGSFTFTIPPYPQPEDWNILIAGRAEYEDGFSRSIHFLEEENHAWISGMQYTFSPEKTPLTELLMEISLPDGKGGILEECLNLLEIWKALIVFPFQPTTAHDVKSLSIPDGFWHKIAQNLPRETEAFRISDIPPPAELIREELGKNYTVNDVFVTLRQNGRAMSYGNYREVAFVYASYTEGDAIYCMNYTCYLPEDSDVWLYGEPVFWEGVALDVAAYAARRYYAEETGAEYRDISLSLMPAANGDATYTLGYTVFFNDEDDSCHVIFAADADGYEPALISVHSDDGQSGWKVTEYAKLMTFDEPET